MILPINLISDGYIPQLIFPSVFGLHVRGSVEVLLDDFDVIIWNDWFVDAKVVLMPHLGRMLVTGERQPCFVASSDKAKPKKES